MIKIPLLNSPSQTFTTTINNVDYSLRVIYNTRKQAWSMDISGGGFTINGVPLVGGVDILRQYSIPIKNMYIINVSGSSVDATIDNLSEDMALIIATDEEIEALI